MREEGRSENKFPVLWSYKAKPADRVPVWVPWDWVDKFARRLDRNHGQTVLRLAERGGLCASEIWCAANDRGLFEPGNLNEAASVAWLRSEPWLK